MYYDVVRKFYSNSTLSEIRGQCNLVLLTYFYLNPKVFNSALTSDLCNLYIKCQTKQARELKTNRKG